MAQLASVLAWGASGRRFKSCHSDTKNKALQKWKAFLFYDLHTF